MKHTLSSIFARLQEAYDAQPSSAANWATGAQIVETLEDGVRTCWVRHDSVEPLLNTQELNLLRDHDLLEEGGKLVKKRSGRTSREAIGVRFSALEKLATDAKTAASDQAKSVVLLTKRVKELEKQLSASQEANAVEHALAELIAGLRPRAKAASKELPTQFRRVGAPKGKAHAGVPTLFLSDWHWGEQVDPRQVEFLNDFNLSIAKNRADRVFNTSLELLFHHQAGQCYDGIVVPLGGDMLSGIIHEDLWRTNQETVQESTWNLAETLAHHLTVLAENFEWVYVPCVVGNHGRVDPKMGVKNAVRNNSDWMLYRLVSALVERNTNANKSAGSVDVHISDSLDLRYGVYGTNYLLTHGDQFSLPSTNHSNLWSNLASQLKSKQSRSSKFARQETVDYMVCGHFHQYGTTGSVIVNGSLKGYDEYAYKKNYEFERPVQALWVTHPEYGITGHYPVFADEQIKDQASSAPPITKYTEATPRR